MRILTERLSQSETYLPLRQICYYSPPKEVGASQLRAKDENYYTICIVQICTLLRFHLGN